MNASGGRDPHEPPADENDWRPWSAVGGARLRIDTDTAPFSSNPHSLFINCNDERGNSCGVSNPGFWGIAVSEGIGANLNLYARSTGKLPVRLIARLRASERVVAEVEVGVEAVVPSSAWAGSTRTPRGGWAMYSATLMPQRHAMNATLELVLYGGRGVFWLDAVSLFPSDAVGGLFRRDIFERLKALRPGFVRLPGGNALEGFGPRTRWRWKATVGHWAARPGHYNAAWGYWVTDGLGVYEMLRLCELLDAPCMMSIYTGYSMRAQCA